MLRKQPLEDNEKLDRWLVSYADFITLLFAFFVVMYSISQVNEGKYRILSQSLLSAFDSPEKSLEPIQQGELNLTEPPKTQETLDITEQPASGEAELDNYASKQQFDEIQQTLEKQLDNLIQSELVDVKRSKDWIEIDLRSALLFESGSDRLETNALVVLREIANTLQGNQQLIKIRGHSDNIPIETERFSSNWALSAGRAVAVVRLLQQIGITPQRMAAEAFGEHRPIATNSTAEGRSKNRRVTVAISRYQLPDAAQEASSTRLIPEGEAENTSSESVGTSQASTTNTEATSALKDEESNEKKYEIIRLPDGGLVIRGKKLPEENKESGDGNDQQ